MDIYNYVEDYLVSNNLTETLNTLRNEFKYLNEEKNKAFCKDILELNLNLDNKIFEMFNKGSNEEFFELFELKFKNSKYNNDCQVDKLKFLINVYFAVYPIIKEIVFNNVNPCNIQEYNFNEMKNTMTKFKNYLEMKEHDFLNTNNYLSYYALPYICNPLKHPTFKKLFTKEWFNDIKNQLKNLINDFNKLEISQIEDKNANFKKYKYKEITDCKLNQLLIEFNKLKIEFNEDKLKENNLLKVSLIECQIKWSKLSLEIIKQSNNFYNMLENIFKKNIVNNLNNYKFDEIKKIKDKLDKYEKFVSNNLTELLKSTSEFNKIEDKPNSLHNSTNLDYIVKKSNKIEPEIKLNNDINSNSNVVLTNKDTFSVNSLNVNNKINTQKNQEIKFIKSDNNKKKIYDDNDIRDSYTKVGNFLDNSNSMNCEKNSFCLDTKDQSNKYQNNSSRIYKNPNLLCKNKDNKVINNIIEIANYNNFENNTYDSVLDQLATKCDQALLNSITCGNECLTDYNPDNLLNFVKLKEEFSMYINNDEKYSNSILKESCKNMSNIKYELKNDIKINVRFQQAIWLNFALREIRCRLGRKKNYSMKQFTLYGILYYDFFGIRPNSSLLLNTISIYEYLLIEPTMIVESIKLINVLCNEPKGRNYFLNNKSSFIEDIFKIMTRELKESELRQNCLGIVQKLTLKSEPQNKLIELDAIKWIVSILVDEQKNSQSISEYTLEYGLALLMNLSLKNKGRDKCEEYAVKSDSVQVRTCVNGILYSLIKRKVIKDIAKSNEVDKILIELLKNPNDNMKKQLEYILYELNSNYTEESSIDNINNISNINTEELNEEDENIDEEYIEDDSISDELIYHHNMIVGMFVIKDKQLNNIEKDKISNYISVFNKNIIKKNANTNNNCNKQTDNYLNILNIEQEKIAKKSLELPFENNSKCNSINSNVLLNSKPKINTLVNKEEIILPKEYANVNEERAYFIEIDNKYSLEKIKGLENTADVFKKREKLIRTPPIND